MHLQATWASKSRSQKIAPPEQERPVRSSLSASQAGHKAKQTIGLAQTLPSRTDRWPGFLGLCENRKVTNLAASTSPEAPAAPPVETGVPFMLKHERMVPPAPHSPAASDRPACKWHGHRSTKDPRRLLLQSRKTRTWQPASHPRRRQLHQWRPVCRSCSTTSAWCHPHLTHPEQVTTMHASGTGIFYQNSKTNAPPES